MDETIISLETEEVKLEFYEILEMTLYNPHVLFGFRLANNKPSRTLRNKKFNDHFIS